MSERLQNRTAISRTILIIKGLCLLVKGEKKSKEEEEEEVRTLKIQIKQSSNYYTLINSDSKRKLGLQPEKPKSRHQKN